jgi:hypothetical protein
MYVPPFRPVHRPLPPPVHHHHLPQQLPLPGNYQLSPEQIMHGLEMEGHRLAEQLRSAQEMREHGEALPGDLLPSLVTSLHSLAWEHHRAKQDDEALAAIDKEIPVRRELALAGTQEDREKLYLALYNSLVLKAIILTALGRTSAAKAARAEAKKAWHVSLDARTDGAFFHFTRKVSRKLLGT